MATLELKKSFTVNGESVRSIEIDEPSIGAVEVFEAAKAAGDTDMVAMIKMMAVDLEWPVEAVRKIKVSDLVKISETLAPFVAPAGPTGESSSPT